MIFELVPGQLSLADCRQLWQAHSPIQLAPACFEKVEAANQFVETVLRGDQAVYGINTGFGSLANQRIAIEDLQDLQRNLVLSHAAGVGPNLPDEVVALSLLLKINALAQGYSGVRKSVLDSLVALYNAKLFPCVPAQGSVGASGDLAPLAHIAAGLMGHGQVRLDGELMDAVSALEAIGLPPVVLEAKEGLALINGTQVSTALALQGLFATEDVFEHALVTGALSVEAAGGSSAPFRESIQVVRGHPGQKTVAAKLRGYLDASPMRDLHRECDRVQDPYSLRCQAVVMGTCLEHREFAATVLSREMNAVTDNPLVFADEQQIVSGGNFHAEPVAMAADNLAMILAEIGSIAERRIAVLMNPVQTQLAPYLVENGGLNSGFMIGHVTAAALASENKQQAYPACVDSIPTSNNQEDHVSMATHGAKRLLAMAENVKHIIAIELLAACQGIELRRPAKTSALLERRIKQVRALVSPYTQDRFFALDIEHAVGLINSGQLLDSVV